MHEFSIALSIVEIADEEAKKANAIVEKIELEIGELSGVELDALNFVWEAAVKNSVLAEAEKNIRIIKGEASCLDCGHQYPALQFFSQCPACSSMMTTLTRGRELKVKAITLLTRTKENLKLTTEN